MTFRELWASASSVISVYTLLHACVLAPFFRPPHYLRGGALGIFFGPDFLHSEVHDILYSGFLVFSGHGVEKRLKPKSKKSKKTGEKIPQVWGSRVFLVEFGGNVRCHVFCFVFYIRLFSTDRIIILTLNIICACVHMSFKHVAAYCTVSCSDF